jgi:glycosyltransferase involved in cell wall biosynthesis
VLTNQNGMQPRIAAYLEEHGPIPNLEFVYVPRQRWELAIGEKPFLKYVAYRRWQRRAFHVAQRLHAHIDFDIAHHVTFNGFREPSHLYKLGIPFVWGPVGGAQNYPWRFLPGAGLSNAAVEAARSVLNVVQLHASPRVRGAARSAAAIFAANPENEQSFRQVLGAEAILMCDAGAPALSETFLTPSSNSGAIRILWAGNLATWKALELLIEALALMPADVPYELRVLGDGPRRRQWQRLAEQRGIDRHVQWYGRVPTEEVLEQFRWTDVFVFTSLRDTSGSVVLEAMAAARPVICLDHQGVGAMVTPECGIKIPVTNRRDVEHRLCEAIAFLQRDRSRCRVLGEGARRRAAELSWSHQGQRIAREYNRILESIGSVARCELEVPHASANNLRHESAIDAGQSPLVGFAAR